MPPKSTSRRVASSLHLEDLAQSWYRSLEAADRAPLTLRVHRETLEQLERHLCEQEHSLRIVDIARVDVEGFILALRQRYAPNTVRMRFIGMRAFFNWCVAEEEIPYSPMARMKAPKVFEHPPSMLSRADLEALLKTCSGKSFNDRRDRAIFLLLVDTGMRLDEIRQLTLDTIDLKARTYAILGKGRRMRKGAFEAVAAAALDAYLRARQRYVNQYTRHAERRELWIGKRGPISNAGIYQMVKRRAQQAGLSINVHPHLFRHGFAHDWLAAGGNEGDLARLAGWSPGSRMIYRYGAAQAEERAREAHKRLSPANRLGRNDTTKPKR